MSVEAPTGELDTCAACGRDLWAFGPPAQDGDVWICADCDAARNLDVLDC
jgi:hypothetical protein